MTTHFAETTKRCRNDRGARLGGRARRADSPHAEASAGKGNHEGKAAVDGNRNADRCAQRTEMAPTVSASGGRRSTRLMNGK
ncbi:hypothetical protein KTE60_29855 [Burkholderia multivorans]|uniref:hypothetical protein n=1 Tax=Burkholderia multivorans TaxID=87883 RepID=UPI001C226246|nr:hypothetical protein [Burkholderia multivorans]MBU9633499.1 hypothetical protein [Burkholderia multivorans]